MSISGFAPPWLDGLFADAEVAALWSGDAQIARMLEVERALTEATAEAGRISPGDRAAALATLDGFVPDMADLASGTAQDGVVVPALVRQLRAACPAPGAIHPGATSQDIVDSALALTLRELSRLLSGRLHSLAAALEALEARHGANRLMARTRMQAALPITAGHRIATWRRMLDTLRRRQDEATRGAVRLQLGGPVGDRSSFGPEADLVARGMSDRLGLPDPGHGWHSERLGIVAYGGWLAHLTGSLGKMGQDIALMTQQGVDAARLGTGGASSSMARKINPVGAELLVSLARFGAAQAGALQEALVHEQERSGAAWMLEWMVLPQLASAAGRSASAGLALVGSIRSLGDGPPA